MKPPARFNGGDRYQIDIGTAGSIGAVSMDIGSAKRMHAELGKAIEEADAALAASNIKASPMAVREAIQALVLYVWLQDGTRGANRAIWGALRALAPELANLANSNPEAAARAIGVTEPDDVDDSSKEDRHQ